MPGKVLKAGDNHNLLANRHQGNPHRQYHLRTKILESILGGIFGCPVTINPSENPCSPILLVNGAPHSITGDRYRRVIFLSSFANNQPRLGLFMETPQLGLEDPIDVYDITIGGGNDQQTISRGRLCIQGRFDRLIEITGASGAGGDNIIYFDTSGGNASIGIQDNVHVGGQLRVAPETILAPTDQDQIIIGKSVTKIKATGGLVEKGWRTTPFFDMTSAFNSLLTNLPIFFANGDEIYVGMTDEFYALDILLQTKASQSILPTFEYSTGAGSWASLTVVDGTAGFTADGFITWKASDVPGWVANNVNGVSLRYVRITRTEAAAITNPVEFTILAVQPREIRSILADIAGSAFGDTIIVDIINAGAANLLFPVEETVIDTLSNVSHAWRYTGVYTDSTAAFNSPTTDVVIFNAVNDYVYVGSDIPFSAIDFDLATLASGSITPVFEHSNGGGWQTFSPVDGTNGMQASGRVTWLESDMTFSWDEVTVNGVNKYWIRIQRTNAAAIAPPTENLVQLVNNVASDRIVNDAGDFTLAPGGTGRIWYDTDISRWRALA